MLNGLDTLQPMTEAAPDLLAYGFSFAMRYLKNLTTTEIAALHDGGVALGLIFEQGAGNALGGATQGTKDGEVARKQAAGFGAPEGCTIFATVDCDVSTSQLAAIYNYMNSFAGMIAPDYKLGVYGCGTVLRSLPNAVTWLAGAMGWSGSHSYKDWIIKQGPTFSGGQWEGQMWPNIGFPYDPNLATHLEWSWSTSGKVPDRPVALPTLRMGSEGIAVVILQNALNRNPLKADGDFGQVTDYAVRSFQQAAGLTVDGVVGPATWAALNVKSEVDIDMTPDPAPARGGWHDLPN